MRRRSPAVQQSGIAKQEGARADRAEPADVAGLPADPGNQPGMVLILLDAGATGDEECVEPFERTLDRSVGQEAGAIESGDRIAGQRDDLDGVGVQFRITVLASEKTSIGPARSSIWTPGTARMATRMI